MSERPPVTRTDAPAYLARYLEKKKAQTGGAPPATAYTTHGKPPYMEAVIDRSRARAEESRSRADAPPGGLTHDYAVNTVSPREIMPPEGFVKERYGGATAVRLIRHGQTQGYATDAGLSALGRWQAHRAGQSLARSVKPGGTVRIPYAPTARAKETALALHEGLMEALARYGIEADVQTPVANDLFKNFQVWSDAGEMDPTAAFMRYNQERESLERRHGGDWPGWMTEMKRFWDVEAGGGDPITHWLTMPMQFFEPAALVVRRMWRGVLSEVQAAPPDSRIFVCCHSGPIRAVATAAFGHDPGEPFNLEDVRIRVFGDHEHAVVTYRGRGLEIEVPTTRAVSWAADRVASSHLGSPGSDPG